MKNNSILNIYQFLDKIDISKLEDTNLVCKVLYNLSKLDGENSKIKKRFESVQSKLFKDKTDRVSELSELRKSKNMEYSKVLELLDDEKEEIEKGFDWLVIPEIDTTEPELPNNEYFEEKEKETLGFISSLFGKVESLLQSPQN